MKFAKLVALAAGIAAWVLTATSVPAARSVIRLLMSSPFSPLTLDSPHQTISSLTASHRTLRCFWYDSSDMRNVAVSMNAWSVEHFGVPRL